MTTSRAFGSAGFGVPTASGDTATTNALLDLARACAEVGTPWALIGGQALLAYGVPRETLDADAFTPPEALQDVAEMLVRRFGWTPLRDDEESGDYIAAEAVTTLFMDDPVLFDVHEERRIVPLRSQLGLLVELLAAQHPIEVEMIDAAVVREFRSVRVPIAPLGGILLVKTKADRPKDVAAIEQTGEHLPAAQMQEALAWAMHHDASTAEDLRAILDAVRLRRTPRRRSTRGTKAET